jgi:hypothetical protein
MARQFRRAATTGAESTIVASSLTDLLDEFACAGPILVKMDIEGAELAIFRAPAWLDRIHAVLVEPHGAGTGDLIRDTLHARGFLVSEVGEKILGRRAPW